jgi:hypothetical protein
MKDYKSLLLFFILLITTTNYGQYTDVINSNRPGESMSAFSVGKTVIQAELGGYGIIEKNSYNGVNYYGLGSDLTLRYGVLKEQLEFILDLQYQKDILSGQIYKRSDIKQTSIGAKFLFFDAAKNIKKKKINVYSWKKNQRFDYKTLIPSVALYAGANLNISKNDFSFPTDPTFSPKVALITQNQFSNQVLVINIIADKLMTDFPIYGCVITLTRGINERWSAFGEGQAYISNYLSDGILRGGAAFLVTKSIQIDASIGINIKKTPYTLTAAGGLSWRFDANYNEVRIPKDKNKAKKEKKGKKEKTPKNKD